MKGFFFALLFLLSTSGIAQDLIVTSVTGNKVYGVNDIFSASITVKNNGIVKINSATIIVNIYLSADGVLDNADFYVGNGSIYTVNAGASVALTFTDNKQITVPTGAYNLIAVADPGHKIQETDETNNTLVVPGYTVGVSNFDFTFSSFSVASTLYIHDTFNPQFLIANPGIYSSANRLFTSYFLSKDQTLDASDLACGKLNNWLNQPLNNSNSTFWDKALEIPNVKTGQYYVIAKVDSDNSFIETNENNNTAVSGAVTIDYGNIDLQVQSLFIYSTTPTPGSFSGSGSFSLYNNGTTGAANVDFQAFLSTDQFFDYADQQLQLVPPTSNPVAAKSSTSIQLNFSSYTIGSGTYYIIVVADPSHSLGDSNYSDNTKSSDTPIVISPPNPPSISVVNSTFADAYDNTDKSFTFNTTFLNSGTAFFSDIVSYQITIKNSSNVVQYTTTLNSYLSINPGSQSNPINWNFTLTNPLPYGTYSVNLSCADASKCNADSYNFTLKVDQSLSTLSGTIQGEDGTPITSGKLFLYQKDINGIVTFTQKIAPTTSSSFSFSSIDNHQHTLYFIPDAADYPQYVPTILKKTVTLSENNFVKISKDTSVVFEVLKLAPLPSGSQTIQGNVSTGATIPSGRVSAKSDPVRSLAIASIPVLLLNSNGDPVAITQTDVAGNYAFNNLPPGNYQILVVFELDQPNLMKVPFPVDATTSGKMVNFNFSSGSLTTVIKNLQSITFSDIASITYAHDPITLTASSSSALPVSYTSSDPSVATIQDNKITVTGVGICNITVSQPGNNTYVAANDVVRVLRVEKGSLSVIAQNKTKAHGDPNPQLTFTFDGFKAGENVSTSGITPPSITTSATQNSDAGSYPISFTGGDGGAHYVLSPVNGLLTIGKVDQKIQFDSNLPYNITVDTPPITFEAESSSGLPVTFQVIEGADVVTQKGSTFTLTGKTGRVTVRIQQAGDVNYKAAISIDRSFKVNLVLGVEPETSALVSMSPNPTQSELYIKAGSAIRSVTLWNMLGEKINYVENLSTPEYYLNLTSYNRGIYLVSVATENEGITTRRIFLE